VVRRLASISIAVAVVLLLLAVASAQAAFPGKNGKIAFHRQVPASGPFYQLPDLFVIDPDGTSEQNLTHSDDSESNPAWPADGTRLVYVTWGIVTTSNADASDPVLLLTGGQPAWSLDGTQIAYARPHVFYPGTDNSDIWVMNADGTGNHNVIGDPAGDGPYDYEPRWSPDGTRIAFEGDRASSGLRSLYTVRPDGTGLARLTNSYGERSPDWSPDGSRFVYDDAGDIAVLNASGTGYVRLTQSPTVDSQPVWSPDGEQIAFTRRNEDTITDDLYVMNADGSNPHMIARNASYPDWQPLPNRPPICDEVTAVPDEILRHNRTLVTVSLTGASDPDGDPVTLEITGVTQDEPVGAQPDAREGDTPDTVRLRAERASRGDGRVYRIDFEATDGNGGSCAGTATVGVPRRRSEAAIDSAPPSYDSFGG
jgi:WD40-like Beta Propeller Repeat